MKIFWSWQSDHDPKIGHFFVRNALTEAAKQLAEELEIEEADRLEVDHDTKGVSGWAPIVTTIQNKIKDATVVVADVTPVGKTNNGTKLLLNSNVMIELGYALHARGYERLLLVANRHYLQRNEDLPFDMRGNRGPITYTLAPDADAAERKIAHRDLVGRLKVGLTDCFAFEKSERAKLLLGNADQPTDSRSKWFEEGVPLTYVDAFQRNPERMVQLPVGPHSFMKIRPAVWPKNVMTSSLSPNSNNQQTLMIGRVSNGDWGQTSDGILSFLCGRQDDGKVTEAEMLAQWFAESGVIWAVWTGIVSDSTPLWFYGRNVMRFWGRLLEQAVPLMISKGAKGPFRIDAGVIGIKSTRWSMPMENGALYSAANDVRLSAIDLTADEVTQHRYLAALYNRLTDAFGFSKAITPDQVPGIIQGRSQHTA